MVVAMVQDLFFAARIRETAAQLGLGCEIVREPADLPARVAGASVIVVDMSARRGDPAEAVRALKADAATRAIPVIGYLFDSHDETIREARAAGCDKVLSRGGLTQKLPDLLRPR